MRRLQILMLHLSKKSNRDKKKRKKKKVNYVRTERGWMLFHLPVTPERPKLTEIRPKLVLKGSRFHRHGEKVVGQKVKTGLEARDKVSIRLKTDEHVVHVLSLKASRRKETLIISSRGLAILAPLYL